MNGFERVKLQIESGVRPIVEDIDELYVVIGLDNVQVLTPIVETKLRSGLVPKLPLQVLCTIKNCRFNVKLTFKHPYPEKLIEFEFLSTLSTEILMTKSIEENVRNYSTENFQGERYAVKLIKYIEQVISLDDENFSGDNLFKEKDLGIIEDEISTDAYYRCKKCRYILFENTDLLQHEPGTRREAQASSTPVCMSYFLQESPSWLNLNEENKILCPNTTCSAKIGSWSWSGSECSCGSWIAPSFQFVRSKIDEIKIDGLKIEKDSS